MAKAPRARRNPWLPAFALGVAVLIGSLVGLAIAIYQASSPSSPAPAAAAAAIQTDTATPLPSAAPREQPSPTATATPAPTQQPQQSNAPSPPNSGRWIDIDVTNYTVRLMDGTAAVQVIGPVAVGAQIDTGAYESTQTGLFHVYSMNAALTYDAPYKTYISDWVGFDPTLANGLHSFLKDKNGNVVDASTGNVSNGCIRTPDPQAIYDFARIGMPVYVHR